MSSHAELSFEGLKIKLFPGSRQKYYSKAFFCVYILGMNFFLAQEYWRKCTYKILVKLTIGHSMMTSLMMCCDFFVAIFLVTASLLVNCLIRGLTVHVSWCQYFPRHNITVSTYSRVQCFANRNLILRYIKSA
jgi:hypothetical protein